MSEPSWLIRARRYIGLREIPGKKHNPKIVEWWERLKTHFRDDETAWCGAFVGGVLVEDGKQIVSGPAGARNWLKLPNKLSKPAVGCVVVFWRGKRNGWSGHVGFVVGKDRNGNLMVLGGNQGDAVNIKPFSTNRVLGYRWPSIAPNPERYNLPIYESDGKVSTNEA